MEPSFAVLKTAPSLLSHWLGHRSSPTKPLPPYAVVLWSFIAAFCGVSVIQAPFRTHYFVQQAVPSVIASYGRGYRLLQGASAVLIYGAIDSPLAQPRALIGGHFIGALIGICISKLFQLLPSERYLELQWLAGSLSVALALVAMQLTKTVHPPAGATALLAAVNQEVISISWYLLPVVLLLSVLGLAVALLVNNIQRRYPAFWIMATTGSGPPPAAPPELSEGRADDKSLTLSINV